MDRNKLSFIIYIVIFCVFITGVGFFYLGKNFGLKVMETGRSQIDRDELQKSEEIITKELNNLFELLNQKEDSKDECQLFSTDYLSKFTDGNDEYNLLYDLAPLMMECLYGFKYDKISDYKVINSHDYNELKKYFNVTLEENKDNKSYYNAYKIPYHNIKNNYNYVLGEIYKTKDEYSADVKVYDEKVLISKGTIKVKVVNNHIYYDYFNLNEH